jgi:hypothetical protein
MTNRIDFIRNEFEQLGCPLQERTFTTDDGGKLWVVFCRQDKQFFWVEGSTQREAWILAWKLKDQIRNDSDEPPMILPFPQSSRKDSIKTARIAYPNIFKP